jgi:steroid delta-isomerase-like uncharacterized protein
MSEENKTIVRRFAQIFTTGNLDDADELFAPGFYARLPGSLEPLDREGWKEFTRPFMTGFSERELVVESVIAEGDEVAARVNFHGRHTGDFQGTPPTDMEIEFSGTAWFRIADGKVVEHWGEFDGMSLMQQLGVGPSPEGTQG